MCRCEPRHVKSRDFSHDAVSSSLHHQLALPKMVSRDIANGEDAIDHAVFTINPRGYSPIGN